MTTNRIDLSTPNLNLTFQAQHTQLRLESFSAGNVNWLHSEEPSGLFGVMIDGQRYSALNMDFTGWRDAPASPDVRHVIFSFQARRVQVDFHLNLYPDTALMECWLVVFNHDPAAIAIQQLSSYSLNLPSMSASLLAFTGDWGSEFSPQPAPLKDQIVLESRSGRSSKGNHPWFALTNPQGGVLSAAVAWSGNWVMRFEPLQSGGHRLTGGLHDWEFSKVLRSHQSVTAPKAVIALGTDLNDVSHQYTEIGRRFWYPRNQLSDTLPIEWNHWWPYEDAEITEEVFLRNVEHAAQMGFEVCTLDAGWFGPTDPDTFWYDTRGDWHSVNTQRFPGGIRKLADAVHAHGMKFGIWCEIEGLGVSARLAAEHPSFVAERDGERLGYVCFGNPAVQEWAYTTLARLIEEYQADWIKVDFNLDPQAGCNRTDHGHQLGDGLFEHYQGYYRTLERIRADFPEVVLENCSSGGLRIDLAMLRHTHMTYLSDPDYPVHDLQIFWGASTMLAPNVLLHWTFGHWRNINPPPQQIFNPHDPSLTVKQWDYYTRISMLGLYGLSQKLPELPGWLARRIVEHNAIYKQHVRRFIQHGRLYRLTSQPLRSGDGERWAAFQYSLPESDEHLLFVFRLPGAEKQRSIVLQGLQPGRIYTVTGLESEPASQHTGASLMQTGLRFDDLDEEESVLLKID